MMQLINDTGPSGNCGADGDHLLISDSDLAAAFEGWKKHSFLANGKSPQRCGDLL